MGKLLTPSMISQRLRRFGIPNAAYFDAANSSQMIIEPAEARTDGSKWTMAFCVNRLALDSTAAWHRLVNCIPETNTIVAWYQNSLYIQISDGANARVLQTTALFRDVTSYLVPIVITWDRDNAVAAEKLRLYAGHKEVTDFVTDNRALISATAEPGIMMPGVTTTIGSKADAATDYITDILSEFYFVDGAVFTPDMFTAIHAGTQNVTAKKRSNALDLGSGGWYHQFNDQDDMGHSENRARNVAATMDPLVPTTCTYSENNNRVAGTLAGSHRLTKSTLALPFDKVFFEAHANLTDYTAWYLGWSKASALTVGANGIIGEGTAGSWGYYAGTNTYAENGGSASATSSITQPSSASDYACWALDLSEGIGGTGYAWLGTHSGGAITWETGDPVAGTSPLFSFTIDEALFVSMRGTSEPTVTMDGNWNHTDALTGFKAIATGSLPPLPNSIHDHFKAITYVGDGVAIGSGGKAITEVGFQPDFVWIKQLDRVDNHVLYDAIRGANAHLYSNTTDGELTGITEGLASFDIDGFTLGSWNNVNQSGTNTAAFAATLPFTKTTGWGAGEVIAPEKETYNPTLGMSIVKYTGTGVAGDTIPHSLGKIPGMILVKRLDAAGNWFVYHKALGNTKAAYLNNTGTPGTGIDYWNNTDPASTLVTLGTNSGINALNGQYVAYIFAETSYCKIGSYEGNADADGPFLNLEGSPKWYMGKNVDSASSTWPIYDIGSDPFNHHDTWLAADTTDAETTNSLNRLNFTRHGVKLRGTASNTNIANTYIYLAFVEPIQLSMLEGNHFKATNVGQVNSTPTNRYDTLNPLDQADGATAANGNKQFIGVAGNAAMRGSIAIPPAGVWYYEFRAGLGNLAGAGVGFKKAAVDVARVMDLGMDPDGSTIGGRFGSTGANAAAKYNGTNVDLGAIYDHTVRFGIEVDFDNDTIKYWAGTTLLHTFTGCAFDATDLWLICAHDDNGSLSTSETVDFYISEDEQLNKAVNSPNSLTICTDNLPKQSGSIWDHMSIPIYTGNGATQTIDFSLPDVNVVWGKNRSLGTTSPVIYDTLRGATKVLQTDNTNAEITRIDGLTAFNGDGTVDLGADNELNGSGNNHVMWGWSLPSSETNISGTISVDWIYNAALGMAVGKYTGDGTTATLGLPTINGTAPSMVVVKRTASVDDWSVYHKALGASAYTILNTTGAAVTATSVPWGDTAPTESVVTVNSAANISGDPYEILCFWETSYCKIGSYEGDGSADGPFVNFGGAPVWLMAKGIDNVSDWPIWDSIRSPVNVVQGAVFANTTVAETVSDEFDFVANGWKIRRAATNFNATGIRYLYLAFVQPNGPIENSAR